jgi:3-dehydroquinate dehydratase II
MRQPASKGSSPNDSSCGIDPSLTFTVINGPNMGELGTREPEIYGTLSHDGLVDRLGKKAEEMGFGLDYFQSDVEGELVAAINSASRESSGLVINPAAYSHYSVAILDAMRAFQGPVVEVHISNVFSRESCRSRLVTAGGADAVITGAGVEGYEHALEILLEMTGKKTGGNLSAHQQ